MNYWLIKLTPINILSEKNILVLGDSTPECAINDKIFKQVFNFSSPAESYYYSFLKLRKILESNQDIDTVLLSFSPHNVFDNNWFQNNNHIQHNFCRYYPLMSWHDLKYLLEYNQKILVYSCRHIPLQFLKNGLRKISRKTILKLGGFKDLDLDRLVPALQALQEGKRIKDFKLPQHFGTTIVELHYLQKIVVLCKENELKLIFINLPKHPVLIKNKGYGIQEFQQMYKMKFNQISYFDFSNFPLEDEFFVDLVHLNREGAICFSEFLSRRKWKDFKYTQ
jgi:hypothetical protein